MSMTTGICEDRAAMTPAATLTRTTPAAPHLTIFYPLRSDPPPLTATHRRKILLGRAERLLASGDVNAAGMTARVVLEQAMRGLCRRHDIPLASRQSLGGMLDKLRRGEHLPRGIKTSDMQRMLRIANKASHGRPVCVNKVAELIVAVRAFCTAVRRSRPSVAQ